MRKDWIPKWLKLPAKLPKISRKRILLLAVLGAVALGTFSILSFVSSRINRKAQADFELATSHYREAQNSQGEKRREECSQAKTLYEDILGRFLVRDKRRVRFYLGSSLQCLGEYGEAASVFEQFLDRYSTDYFSPLVEIRLASCYEEMEEFEKAIKAYEAALEKHPEKPVGPQASLGMARCLELQGKLQEAEKRYQELISRYPLSPEKEIAEARIQHLKAEGQGS